MEHVFDADEVRGVLHTPEHATGDGLALTHGAGSNANAALLVSLSRAFCGAGLVVLRYDLPFRVARPGGPPGPEGTPAAARDRQGVARAVEALRRRVRGRVFAGGHSYGGRQTAMIAAERPGLADGLLLLSYPLHPPKKTDQPHRVFPRVAHSRALRPRHARPLRHAGRVARRDAAYPGARGSAGGGRRGARPEAGGADGRRDPGTHAILKNNPRGHLYARILL